MSGASGAEPPAPPTATDPDAPPGETAGAIARGGFWAFGGLVLGAALQFGYNVALARIYGANATGIFAFVLSLTTVAAIISQLGARETLLRYVSAYRATDDTGLLRGVVLYATGLGLAGSLAAGALLAWAAPAVADLADKPEVTWALGLLAWTVPFIAGTKATASALQATRRIQLYALLHDVGRPLSIVIGIGIAFGLGLRFETFLGLYLAAAAIVFTVGLWLMTRHLPVASGPPPAFRPRVWLRFSLAVMFLDAFRSTGGWMDTLVLGFFVDADEVGIYFAALRTALLITLALSAFNTILSPMAAEAWGRSDRAALARVFTVSTRWTCAVVIPVAVATILLRHELMSAFGDDFVTPTSGLVLLIILLGRFVNGLTGGVGRMLIMTGHERVELADTILSITLLLGGMLFAVPRFGLVGAAVVNAGVIAFINVLKLVQVRLYIGIQPYDASYLKLLAAGSVAAVAGYVLLGAVGAWPPLVRLVVVAPAVAAAYLATLAPLGLEAEDRAVLAGVRRRLGL